MAGNKGSDHGETTFSISMPLKLVKNLDTIAMEKNLKEIDVIIEACTFYCDMHEMNNPPSPATMRNIVFELAHHDNEFRHTIREISHDNTNADSSKRK